jgi:YidC/Oxa1 family membrane protein insertase
MNKQTITGLVVIALILFGFSWYQNNQQKKFLEEKRVQDSIARANRPAVPEAQFDSVALASAAASQNLQTATPQSDPLGAEMAAARSAETQYYKVSNEVLDVEFSSLGGAVSDVVLKDYFKYGGEPLHLWKQGSQAFDVEFFIKKGFHDAQINTRDFNFTCEVSGGTEWREGEESKTVSMRLPVDSLAYVEFLYTIPRSDYMIGYQVNFVGMRDMMSTQTNFGIEWANTSLQNEKGFDNENRYTTIAYHYPGEKGVEQLGIANAGGSKNESEPSRMKWIAFKQQFFSSFIIADDAFQGADMDFATSQPGEGTIKKFHTRVNVPMEPDKTSYGFSFYFGPNDFSILKGYDLSMDKIITMGWMSFGWVTRLFIIPVFDWLGGKIASFGLIILILTLIIKTIIFPLTFTSYKSSAKMRVIKPEVDEINARFPAQEDAMKKQQAVMELYKRAGINPMAGCIPMLIQFPIIIAAFRFFPEAIELRQQPLWWADDLSSYDSILNFGFNIPFYGNHVSLFALLMAVSMFGVSWINTKQQAAQPQMAGMKFMMLYLMPIMLLFWFNNYSAGLCFYYLLSNLFTFVQMYAVRWAIDEDKLRKKMLEAPVKERKKSGFMARLEAAQKAQQEAARRQQQSAGGLPPTKNRRPAQQPSKKKR